MTEKLSVKHRLDKLEMIVEMLEKKLERIKLINMEEDEKPRTY